MQICCRQHGISAETSVPNHPRPCRVPNISHCQITRSTRLAREVGIIKPNPNPKTLILTQEINKHLRTRLCEIAHAQWRGCELFDTTPALAEVVLLTVCQLLDSDLEEKQLEQSTLHLVHLVHASC